MDKLYENILTFILHYQSQNILQKFQSVINKIVLTYSFHGEWNQ